MGHVALGVEACAALFIATGAVEAVYLLVARGVSREGATAIRRKEIWVASPPGSCLPSSSSWLPMSSTAISPTWHDVGQLAAIAAIRTGLNYFLEKDIEQVGESQLAH